MKAKLALGILGASLVLAGPAFADRDDDVEDSGYDYGTDAAHEFCKDLRAPTGDDGGGFETRNITRRFSRECKRGFDDYINNNRSCGRRIRREHASSTMWEARRSACE